jgi:DNA primase
MRPLEIVRVWSGFRNVVALMGASCSSQQAELFVRLVVLGGLVNILTNGDEAGQRCAVSVFSEVARVGQYAGRNFRTESSRPICRRRS